MKTTITVDAARIEGEIDPMIYGHFIENMARCTYGGLLRNERPGRPGGPWKLRDDLVGMVKEMKPPVLRWPGGLYADGYSWRDGVGPSDARPLRRNRYWSRYGPLTRVLDPNIFGSDEFMALARDVEATPYVNVNLGTGTAAEAARWVEYMNSGESTVEGRRRAEYGHKAPWGVRWWGIGNEIYGRWALGHSKPGEYARRYMEFKGAMGEADPDLRYVAVGADRYLSKNWNREVLSEIGGEMDLLSIHIYLPGMERAVGVAASRIMRGGSGLYRAIVASPLDIERRLTDAVEDIESVMGKGGGPGIALDEWNLWWLPTQLLSPRWTLRDALFVCGTFHAMHRLCDRVKMANIAQLVNVLGLIVASGDRVARTTLYYPFVMYSNLSGTSRVKSDVKCETFSSPAAGGIPSMEDVPVLDCSATLSDDRKTLTLFVINRDMTEDVEVELEVDGFDPRGKVEVHCLNGPDAGAVNWYGRDEVVNIKMSRADAGDILPRRSFPAHSATALVFRS